MKKLFCLITTMSVVIGVQELIGQGQAGMRRVGTQGGTRTTAEIMATSRQRKLCADEMITRSGSNNNDEIGLNFLGARVEQVVYSAHSGGFPPDTMGAIGPTQFIVAINGRIRSFDKKTGQPDFILDTTTDNFFVEVSDGRPATDIRIRYDRFSERWFIIMITGTDAESGENGNNRIMFAVSDTKEISFSTLWDFNFFEVGDGFFLDYPTLGIDNQALYISGLLFFANSTTFPSDQSFYVVNKEELIVADDLIVTEFTFPIGPNIGSPSASFVLQGVDNFDKDATVGHFIGVDSFITNHLLLYRIFDPGSDSPTVSEPILIQVPEICQPLPVPQRGVNRNLDASTNIRLLMAHIRDGHLWTAHQVGVNNKGKCSTIAQPTRDGARWYEINIKQDQPSLIQYGTLFDKTKKNGTNARYFWIPSLMTSGQGTMALGCSTAGKNRFINCAIARRFKHDPKGTLQKPIKYTDSDTTYNPIDPSNPLRWGDYSYTSIDPCDDMTIWTIQEYCVDTDQWGVQVAQLRAPDPAKPVEVKPCIIPQGKSSKKLIIRGHSHDGSGFFDPGKDFDCRLQVKISGGVEVKKVKYIDPTTIKVTVSTKHASEGPKKIKIINPDGQKVVAHDLLLVVSC